MRVRQVRIGDVLELRRDQVDIDLAKMYKPIGVRGFGRGIFDYPATAGEDLGKLRYFSVEPDRLVVSNIKGWEGAVAVTVPDEHGRIASNRFLTYATLNASVALAYISHWLLSEPGLEALGQASPGSADRNRTLSIKNFEAIEVPLPGIDEQRRIAAHLDSVAKSTRESETASDTANRMFPPQVLPRATSLVLDSARLPMVRVEELAESINDTIHPGNDLRGASEFVGLEHIESHTGRRTSSRPIGDETGRKFRFEPGDVTFGYLRPYLNKVWVADRVGLCSVEQFVLRPRRDVNPDLLANTLRSSIVLDAAVEATNNLQLPRLRLGTLMSFKVPDIRHADSSLLSRLNALTEQFVTIDSLRRRRTALLAGLLPAARNEVFNAMR